MAGTLEALTGPTVAEELTLMPGERDDQWSGSLKTEEKTKLIDSLTRGGRILRLSTALDRPTSAPTGNWFEPDRTNAGQRLNSSSLERR